ncbi:thiamine diphosphokinase [Clostridium cadaveris]|uniref:thiamine diphosphokinase n=1 Tax=Clostridium cadaveris TaxID=1529 RepID=UPI0039A395B6
MKSVMIAGGAEPSKEILMEELKDADFVICADRGIEVLYKNGLTPNMLVGDFDSINQEVLSYYKEKGSDIVIYPPEKNYTDSEIAFEKAMNKSGTDIICLLGCTGTRMDHVIGNMGLLNKALDKGIKAYIRDNNNYIFLIDKSTKLKNIFGKYISFQGFREDVSDFNIEGAKYGLTSHNLLFGDPLTVSNEFVDEYMKVSFPKGKVMVIYSRD